MDDESTFLALEDFFLFVLLCLSQLFQAVVLQLPEIKGALIASIIGTTFPTTNQKELPQ